jgi:tRNA threonylcarbamoyladenosine modification (KEOPS) complex  Pcc1 subunit
MRHECLLTLSYPHPAAEAIAGALAPEAAHSEVPKTRGRVGADADGLRIEIEAGDLPSLRAAVNSHLRWVDAAARAARIARE